MSERTVAQNQSFQPATHRTDGILQRKCACGNHTPAGGECAECAKKKGTLQRKLIIGASNDPLEQEADRIADQVLAAPVQIHLFGASPRIQRFPVKPPTGHAEAPASVDQALASSGRPLEPTLRQDMEQRFGRDFSQVRVHSGATAEQSAREMKARAYTVGHEIVFGSGEYAPNTLLGQRLLAHELVHVLQQSDSKDQPLVLHRTLHGPSTPPNCANWTIPLPPWIAGTIAHAQISGALGILPHFIPRASKGGGLLVGVVNPPAITPRGFADLWRLGPSVDIAEIKSTRAGSTVAATEASHYRRRHSEWLTRQASVAGDAVDASYFAAVGGLLPEGILDLSAQTGSDMNLGTFVGDPGKTLHIEADSGGAVVYWCVGIGITGSPLWLPVLKKLMDDLKKALEDAKKTLQEAAARAAEALAELGRALPGILRYLLAILLLIAILALIVVAIICMLGIPVTLGGSSVCSVAAIGGTAAAAAALLLILGLPSPDLPIATANLYRSLQPSAAAEEPGSGMDYERDADVAPGTSRSASSSTAAAVAYNPGDEFLGTLSPIVEMMRDPIRAARSVATAVRSLPPDSVAQLNSAAAVLNNMGDTVTSAFISNVIQNSGLDRPGALAEIDVESVNEALAQLEQGGGEEAATEAPTMVSGEQLNA